METYFPSGPYPEAMDFMDDYVQQIKHDHAEDLIWLLEHPFYHRHPIQPWRYFDRFPASIPHGATYLPWLTYVMFLFWKNGWLKP